MSFNRKARDDQRRREGKGLSLFTLPEEELSKDAKAQSIRMSPFHFALMLASPEVDLNNGDSVYLGVDPSRRHKFLNAASVEATIVDWNDIRANGKIFSSLSSACLEAKSSQGRGNRSSADGWKSTYVSLGADKYGILLYEFHRAFVEELFLPGYDYELLMNVEFLASALVKGKHISRRDAFEMLSKLGYVSKRLSAHPPKAGGAKAKEDAYWSSVNRSMRSFKAAITKRNNKKKASKMNVTAEKIDNEVFDDLDNRGAGDHAVTPEGMKPLPEREPIDGPEQNLKEGETFEFKGDVVDQFEEKVIATQIPGYNYMRLRILQVVSRLIKPGDTLVDFGCSRGKMIRDVIEHADASGASDILDSVKFVGYDIEQEMLDSAKVATSNLLNRIGKSANVSYEYADLLDMPESFEYESADIITAVVSIQFTPIEYRQRIYAELYKRLKPGGALIVMEKVRANSADMDDLLRDLYYDEKARNGLSQEAIEKKRKSIERFLVPETDAQNHENLYQAGFSKYKVARFWQDLQFCSYLAIKD